jgi:hypothetical protein
MVDPNVGFSSPLNIIDYYIYRLFLGVWAYCDSTSLDYFFAEFNYLGGVLLA